MCGIAGGVFWGDAVDRATGEAAVRSMVTSLAHRGPDGEGLHTATSGSGGSAPFVVFGHRRLAILDVTPAGAQPMGGADGKPWITYNGETYNFAELKAELQTHGAQFFTGTDTEVLLRGYDAWGIDLVKRLRGMFAFALWDATAKQVLIARDRLGIKPV